MVILRHWKRYEPCCLIDCYSYAENHLCLYTAPFSDLTFCLIWLSDYPRLTSVQFNSIQSNSFNSNSIQIDSIKSDTIRSHPIRFSPIQSSPIQSSQFHSILFLSILFCFLLLLGVSTMVKHIYCLTICVKLCFSVYWAIIIIIIIDFIITIFFVTIFTAFIMFITKQTILNVYKMLPINGHRCWIALQSKAINQILVCLLYNHYSLPHIVLSSDALGHIKQH